MKRSVTLALKLIRIGYLKRRIYKLASRLMMVSSLLFVTVQYYLWQSIHQGKELLGLSFDQMFAYYFASQILFLLSSTTTAQTFSTAVRSGNIISLAIRPLSFVGQFFAEALGEMLYKTLTIVVPLTLLATLFLGVHTNFNIHDLPYSLCFLAIGVTLSFLFDIIFALLTIVTLNDWGLRSLHFSLIAFCTGRLLPLRFYPEVLQKILESLPFRYMYSYPIERLLHGGAAPGDEWELLRGLTWLLLLAIGAFALERTIRRHLTVQGG